MGPVCTKYLADFGAEVIKIESTAAFDAARGNLPYRDGIAGINRSCHYARLNTGKRSITLNLKKPQGIEVVKRLVSLSDVVVENFSYGTMEKLDLGYETLSKINPELIYASISGYGRSGPRRDDLGYDPVIQAASGITSVTGFKDQPVKCAVAISDFTTSVFAALSISSAYVHRLKTGEGQHLEVSLQDCSWLLASIEFSPYYYLRGKVPERTGNGHPHMTPGSLYKAKDGSVIIATGNLAQVTRLFRLIGGDQLVNSSLCSQQSERIKYREEIDKTVNSWTSERTIEEIITKLKEIDVPCVRVPTFDQVCNDQHLIDREMIIEIEQLVSGPMKVPGSPFKMSKTPGDIAFPAPYHGQHTMEVLTQMLGYSEAEVEELYNKGII